MTATAVAQNRLEFGLITPQHWRTWPELAELWDFAEETGWESAWFMDHFISQGERDDGPCLEGWTALAAMAALHKRLQLGVYVSAVTHRAPSVLFKQALTVDQLSEGRLILAVGAGRNGREQAAMGFPSASPGERFERVAETLELFRRCEHEERTTFDGRHYRIESFACLPKPVNGHIPLMIGTSGERMLQLVARYADRWDTGGTPEIVRERGARLNRRCETLGRDPGAIRWAIDNSSNPFGEPIESVAVFRRHVAAYAAAGIRTFLFNVWQGGPTPVLTEIAERVIPELRHEFAETGGLGLCHSGR
jgi:alkanesulfonate monooxygenase SsuD/methylene tetrahydromethanopterin reductase-like flavin-dependent oxidoreductase (luciferase family)